MHTWHTWSPQILHNGPTALWECCFIGTVRVPMQNPHCESDLAAGDQRWTFLAYGPGPLKLPWSLSWWYDLCFLTSSLIVWPSVWFCKPPQIQVRKKIQYITNQKQTKNEHFHLVRPSCAVVVCLKICIQGVHGVAKKLLCKDFNLNLVLLNIVHLYLFQYDSLCMTVPSNWGPQKNL